MPQFWLLKCEPSVYSIHDLARDGRTNWEGIRNYQVRNFMRDEMKVDDFGVFYHSNAAPSGAAGIVRVSQSKLADPSQFDASHEGFDPKSRREQPTWLMCEVEFVECFAQVVALEALREQRALAEMHVLRRGNRLSVTPLTAAEFALIRKLGRAQCQVDARARSGARAPQLLG